MALDQGERLERALENENDEIDRTLKGIKLMGNYLISVLFTASTPVSS